MGIEFGRISGPLLAANLQRDGVDLVFHNLTDTDNILYIDVINNRIGVNTDATSRTLTVLGTTGTVNLISQTRADIADTTIVTNRIQNATDSIFIQPDQASDPTIVSTKFATAKLEISNQLIENIVTDSDINLSPTGKTVFNSFKVNVDGNLHATGNITWDGDVTIGDDDTDSVNFVAEIASHIIPDVDNTYDLGSDPTVFFPDAETVGEYGKAWANLYVTNFNVNTEYTTENILTSTLTVNRDSILRSTVYFGDDLLTDLVTFNSYVNSSLIPTTSFYALGRRNVQVSGDWDTLFLTELNVDGAVNIVNNTITTLTTDTDLALSAAGTGKIVVTNTDVEITNDLTVDQLTTLTNVDITGLLDLTGDYIWTQTGTTQRTGATDITGSLTVNGANTVQFEDIKFVSNRITTTVPNNNLVLVANGAGLVKISVTDVEITNDLDVGLTGDFDTVNATTVYANAYDIGSVYIIDNTITTNILNTNLVLSADGAGKIHVTTTDVVITNDLEVKQLTTLTNVGITGLLDLTGDYTWTHTGTTQRIGDTDITGSLTVNGANTVQFSDIQFVGNVVRTTLGTDLEFSANGTGIVKTMTSDVEITNDLEVGQYGYFGSLEVNAGIATDSFTVGDFYISNNDIITTVGSNIDIILQANGTGKVYIPTNNASIANDLTVTNDVTVNGNTSLKNTVIRSDISTPTTTQVVQNIAGTGGATGFFFYGWADDPGQTNPPFGVIQVGWTCVQIPGSVVTVVGDGVTNYDITITGGSFTSGGFYSFAGDVLTYGPNTLTQTGNIDQTGNTDITGNLQSASIVIVPNSWIESAELKIQGTTISVKTTNTDLILQANGTGGIVFDRQVKIASNVIGNIFDVNDISLSFNNVLITEDGQLLWLEDESDYYLAEVKNDRDLSVIFEPSGTGNVIIDSNKALAIAYGTAVLENNGEIRQNSVTGVYQGFSSTGTVSLSGLSDNDNNTYLTAELTPGANDNIIRFGINGTEVGYIDATKLYSGTFHLGNVSITNNQIVNLNTSNNLEFNTTGTGHTSVNGVMFNENTVTNVVDNVLTIESTGTGYVKFSGTSAIVIPVGTNSNRPVTPELGQTRLSTERGFVEIWNGSSWVSVSGASNAATEEEIVAETNLWAFVLG